MVSCESVFRCGVIGIMFILTDKVVPVGLSAACVCFGALCSPIRCCGFFG